MDLLIYTPTILAVVVIVARYVRVLQPLWGWLPPTLRWLPGAALALTGHLAQELPGAADTAGLVECLLGGLVLFALAATAGVHAPETSSAPAQKSPLDRVGPAALLVLLVSLSSSGCAGKRPAENPVDYLCSDVAVISIDEACASLDAAVSEADRAVAREACDLLIESQTRVCKAVPR
jgi:hypothetical protein